MKTIIFSLGGSIIVPNKVDYLFLGKFKKLLLRLSKNAKIVVVCGGGKIARDYIKALEKEGASSYERAYMGVECTRLNALLLATFLGNKANQKVPTSPKEFMRFYRKFRIVVLGGALEAFHIDTTTTDGTTAYVAVKLKAKEFINLTNVNGLYDKDPRLFRNAKLIKEISYKDFEVMMRKVKEKPGQHFILDSYAARLVRKKRIKVVILDGRNVKNVENYLNKRKFVGSVIGNV